MTAKQWREKNLDKDGNLREHATVTQLLVLANIEAMNAEFIRMGLSQSERLKKLNLAAISQLNSLMSSNTIQRLELEKY